MVEPSAHLNHPVEAYAFCELVHLWSAERGESEAQVAAALANGVLYEGLVMQSLEADTLDLDQGRLEFRGAPFLGYRASPESPLLVIRSLALRHLVGIARDADRPAREFLAQEYVDREDFRAWLVISGRALPQFWFPA